MSRSANMRPERVPLEDVFLFRRSILRPPGHEEPPKPADLHPRAAHFALRDASGALVAVASIHPEAPPSGAADAWQLRGVATRADARGAGHGRAVVEAALAHARAHGARLAWCHGRVGARAFYERLGFVAHGEPYDLSISGAHFLFTRSL